MNTNQRPKGKRGGLKFNNRYNETWYFKEQFLEKAKKQVEMNELNPYRFVAINNLMEKVGKWENRYNKDVYDFTVEELKAMLKGFNSKSFNSLLSQKSNLEQYLIFAKIRNMGNVNIPATIDLDINDIKGMINNIGREQAFITREELYDIIRPVYDENGNFKGGLRNAMDRVVVMLVFEGILGKEMVDLLNIKWRDIDFENKIIKYQFQYTYKNGELEEIVSYKEKQLDFSDNEDLEMALRETIENDSYMNKNGYATSRTFTKVVSKDESEYLIRPMYAKTKSDTRASVQQIQIKTLTNFKLYLDKPHLTLKSLYISGMVDRAIRYTIENNLDEVMQYKAWEDWLKENDEHANVQTTMKLYHEYYEKYNKDSDGEED